MRTSGRASRARALRAARTRRTTKRGTFVCAASHARLLSTVGRFGVFRRGARACLSGCVPGCRARPSSRLTIAPCSCVQVIAPFGQSFVESVAGSQSQKRLPNEQKEKGTVPRAQGPRTQASSNLCSIDICLRFWNFMHPLSFVSPVSLRVFGKYHQRGKLGGKPLGPLSRSSSRSSPETGHSTCLHSV